MDAQERATPPREVPGNRFWSLVHRRPLLSAAVTGVLLLFTVRPVLLARGDLADVTWATVAVLVVTVYNVGMILLLRRRPPRGTTPEAATALGYALATAPYLVALALSFEGAATWTLWVALAVCVLTLPGVIEAISGRGRGSDAPGG